MITQICVHPADAVEIIPGVVAAAAFVHLSLLGICFWRESFEVAFGPERRGEKGGYGGFSLGFSHLLASHDGSGDAALRNALLWQAPFFALVTGGLLLWGKRQLGRKTGVPTER